MLKLKKLQILGFKSFCDRTEVVLQGNGITAIVGPNGCGKSNISDAISWVLGEQSAKSLRGIKMEDVIFAGTRERKATGMAEVSLTLVDPEVYEVPGGPQLVTGNSPEDVPEVVIEDRLTASGDLDWDEAAVRAARSADTEEAIAEVQPGLAADGEDVEGSAEGGVNPAEAHVPDPQAVVLRIRRRKFQRTPARAGEIVITRRLFRSGESEYLLNGKLCRLRDIQDIFMGTGLGPESYAIIEQERIGQLLSSKPHDRRAILEEAAGITRFKTKKRLSELRLEQAKQNLARVNDIFEEVTRQMGTLKRQAAKAERYAELRDEMRVRLRLVLASRLAEMDASSAAMQAEIAELTTQIEQQVQQVEALDAEHAVARARSYELDSQGKDANARANQANVELERSASRLRANQERNTELAARLTAGHAELEQARSQMTVLNTERQGHREFLETAAAEAAACREQVSGQQQKTQEAARAVAEAEQRIENSRRLASQLLSQAGQARSQIAQAEESYANLEREAERLATESEGVRRDLAALGVERGQVSLSFESVTQTLKRLESEIAILRTEIDVRRRQESDTKRETDKLRAEHATLIGRRNSLDALLREHSYSTDTVRQLFRAKTFAGGLAPTGVLADFLEVDGQHEAVVDSFLRDELNYIVVKDWDSANEGVRLLQKDVDGRATFLVHGENDSTTAIENNSVPVVADGIVRLKDCIRVLNGFGTSLENILPKLRDGYVAPDADTARTLALDYPAAYFLAPSGECFHNVTVAGGKPRAEGPLALKRELRESQQKLDTVAKQLAETETTAVSLTHQISDLSRQLDLKTTERREAERESATSGAALRQMETEIARIERRLQDWNLQTERNKQAQSAKQDLISQKRGEAAARDAEYTRAEAQIEEMRHSVGQLRGVREAAQQAAAAQGAQLAGLEERRRGAAATFERIERLYSDLRQRVAQIEQQIAAAAAEQQQRSLESEQLNLQQAEWTAVRVASVELAARAAADSAEIRERIAKMELQLRSLRTYIDGVRERRSTLSAQAAKLASDLEHLEVTCVQDLGIEPAILRADQEILHLEAAELSAADDQCREMRRRLEAMGPVNMMALEEYKETAERHLFLETQRKDLLDSIANTEESIREIDQISRIKFDEAFARINENFSVTFTKLFGGGQAFMKLTDEENSADSGIDLVASPPGKKLQNVLLLSGGEKALTALSLLVGIFQYQPSPFCVLDEVDAPLDETNVGRLANMLKELSLQTQFVVITHSKRTMSAADVIYGVTMQEPGVSKVISVKLGATQDRELVRQRVSA